MENTKLMLDFEKDALKNIEKAQKVGVEQKKLLHNIKQYGALNCAKNILKRKQLSEGYVQLENIRKLSLSLEALIASNKYNELFSDDEANKCFDTLCQSRFYE